MIRPVVRTRGRDVAEFEQQTLRAQALAAEREAEQMGRQMVEEVVSIVQRRYERRPVDRRKVNTTHLDESFTFRVLRGNKPGGFPFRVELTIKPGVNAKKVAALNNGSPPHEIRPRPPRTKLAWKNVSGGTTIVPQVGPPTTRIHPGNAGGRFMEQARDTVVRRQRAGRV